MTPRVLRLLAASAAALGLATALQLGAASSATRPVAPRAGAVRPASAHAAAVPARGARAVAVAPPVTLPDDSPWALPPVLVLEARAGGRASPALRRRVLGLRRLAFAPAARRAVHRGAVSAGALRLLAALPRSEGPLLVLAASGRRVRAQETTLWMTRAVLRALPRVPAASRPRRLLLEPVAGDRADLAGPPRAKAGQLRTLVGIYRTAGYQYGIDWRVLAAINRVETNLGRNTHTSSAGAVGWMQFLPSTWRRWGVDASGDGVADPYDPQDAIFSAARYLDAAGAQRDLRRAIFAYNHASWYVNEVLALAASLPDGYGA
jgi:hypothetical protein